MPLRCTDISGNTYLAWKLSKEQWDELRLLNKEQKHLQMPCCGVWAVPKRSTLGTPYFAHARKGECASAPETKEHLLAKMIIAQAVEDGGWNAQTEYRGFTPEGDCWIADVYAEKGKFKLAFEVQWSRQTLEETKFRQERYAKSGVRCLWLMKDVPRVVSQSQELPMVPLHVNLTDADASVMIMSYSPYHSTAQGGIKLENFIIGVLKHKFQFAPLFGKTVPISLFGRWRKCPGCETWYRSLSIIKFKASEVLSGLSDFHGDWESFKPDTIMEKALRDAVPLNKLKLGEIRVKYGKKLQQVCPDCDILIPYANSGKKEAELIAEGSLKLPSLTEIQDQGLADRNTFEWSAMRWCFLG